MSGRRVSGKFFGGRLVCGRGYLIGFSVFCVCIVVGISVYEMNGALEEYVRVRVDDEVEGNRVWLAEYVVGETYVDSEEWFRGFKEYCELEGLRCGVVDGSVFVKSERAYSLE